jgi:hypothetical protein
MKTAQPRPAARKPPLPSDQAARTAAKRKPVKVPGKSKKIWGTTKRWFALSRNGMRRIRRMKHRTKTAWRWARTQTRRFTDNLGGSYICKECGRDVLYRRAEEHNFRHAQQKGTAPAGRPANQPNSGPSPAPTNGSPAPTPGSNPTGQAGGQHQRKGKPMAGARGNGRGGGAAGAGSGVASAIGTWAAATPETVAELQAWLAGMESAMNSGAASIHEAANALVSRRIDPSVAGPINQAADEMASLAHQFTEAFSRFQTVYQRRIDYERDQQHKPADTMWKDVGTA